MKSYKIISAGLNSLLETPEVNIKQEDTISCEHFLFGPSERNHISEWDISDSLNCMQFERHQSSDFGHMRQSVSSPSDIYDAGQYVMDSLIYDTERNNDAHFDILEGYSFLWESEDTSPTSTSIIDTPGSSVTTATNSDEDTITSSTRLNDHTSDVQSQSVSGSKRKPSVNSPPDDVGAFFGHPLTRATSTLNGDEVDTNASAAALLHEYYNLPPLEREDIKVDEKLNGFLEIISSQKSDPPLSTVQVDETQTSASDSGPQEILPTLEEEGEVVTEYLYTDYTLDKYLIDGPQSGHAHSPAESSVLSTINSSSRCLRRSKSVKDSTQVIDSVQQKKNGGKRAPRRSRSKTDVVTSTTNSVTSAKEKSDLTTSGQQHVVGVGVFKQYTHPFETKGAVVKTETEGGFEKKIILTPTSNDGGKSPDVTRAQIGAEAQLNYSSTTNTLPQTTFLHSQDSTVGQLTSDSHLLTAINSTGSPLNVVSTTALHPSSPSPSGQTPPATYASNDPGQKDGQENVYHFDHLVKENNFLKKALSEKIRLRQSTEETVSTMPAHCFQFLTDDIHGSVLEPKFAPMASIKQEQQQYMNYADHQFYDSQMDNGQFASLTNSSGMTMNSCANVGHNMVSITAASCDDVISMNDSHTLTGLVNGHSLYGAAIDHQDHRPQHHIGQSDQNIHDAMIVQSAGQYFQVLQPLQPLQPLEPMHQLDSQVSSTNPAISTSNTNYYNYMYHQSEADKNNALERYHQHSKYHNSNYQNFLTTDSYNMKSPDSGYHEPCLSPSMILKEGILSNTSEKPKKKKNTGNGTCNGTLLRQFSNSSCDKMSPKSPAIPKLEVNTTGYSYFLETPISTTQRKDEDKVTYLNKGQYYGLTLNFNSQERIIKCAVVKSVIILAFREEKTMEEERKAWEFWHGRQHSYKQRILDIDTKNCQGVLPHNIEEIAFNAVVVRWNPMDGPVRVNIAVHCLSTDFSNQKGVKGIPLHVQIDTYEQSPKDNHLVHRGYCQIKAFCDKGAERKTRDEERRRVAKSKPDEFGNVTAKTKGRKKLEEAFHEPCDRSEFYSMADTTSSPVFFNPLHETSEFIHKSITLGIVPSQEEDISSHPNSLELPDSCDDYYNASPAKRPRRDSISNNKESAKVLLYVRERHEDVYTALMLEIPTLHGLLKSIEQKYSISPSRVKNLYKKSRKGILVRMDDNIVRHYSHESTFIIEMNPVNEDKDYEIILIEIDPPSM